MKNELEHITGSQQLQPVPGSTPYYERSKSDATWKAYASDWRVFEAWAERNGIGLEAGATPQHVAAFLSAQADDGRAAATIQRRAVAIGQRMTIAGMEDPTDSPLVRETMKGIRRTIGTAQVKKRPIGPAELHEIKYADGAKGIRDRALILLGFAGAFRRSELVALDIEDIEFKPGEGMIVLVRRSKTDQEGAGMTRFIPCMSQDIDAYSAVSKLIEVAGIESGPIFMSIFKGGRFSRERLTPSAVGRIVKRYAAAAGLVFAEFSGHSLRSGCITALAEAGASLTEIMSHTGHRSVEQVAGYVRTATGMKESPLNRLSQKEPAI